MASGYQRRHESPEAKTARRINRHKNKVIKNRRERYINRFPWPPTDPDRCPDTYLGGTSAEDFE